MTLLAATVSDPQFLREYAETRRYLAGRPERPKFSPDGKSVFFLRSAPKDSRQLLYELDVATGKTSELLTPDSLLQGASETLTAAEKARLERQRVSARGFTSYQLSPDGSKLLVVLSGKLYLVERATKKVTQLKTGEGACMDPKFSPAGTHVGYVRNHDVHVVDLAKNTEARVTTGGSELKPNGLAEFVAQEEMSRFSGFWFSPDGKHVIFQKTDHTGLERFGIADPMHPEAEADRFFYPRPGKKNADVALAIMPLAGGKPIEVSWDRAAFPYVTTVKWPKAGALSVVVQSREQTKAQLLAIDPKTGRSTVLVTEEDPAWLNINQDVPHWLPDGSGFFWDTERNGGHELELRKADGSSPVTWVPRAAGYKGELGLVGFEPKSRTLYFLGGDDPTQSLLFKTVNGGAPERVKTPSEGRATEGAVMSDDGSAFVVSTTSTRAMPKHVVLKDGAKVAELPSVAIEPGLALSIETFTLSGPQQMRAAVIRPKDFKKGTKYPVVLNVYGGPGHLEVLEVMRENLVLQWLANQGFLVVKLDGRGTPRRGRDYERAIKGDFATTTANDQIVGLTQLAQKVPELDLTRVGVYGWSFGGYMAALLAMTKGDVIKSAVAGAPVVDWRDYDTHYTERYLGLPDAQPKAYEVSSLLSYVKDAKRPILLIHGTADDNVYFLHSLKLSDALFKAGKPHSVLPLSNFTHMVPDPLVTERLWERIAVTFKETL
ncbi:MAG: DPP IV N-terminal domain-containing protein [Myxococcaceae bacterium]|nr:DPP IV N-terminal domain-containing protein [Myxococcaceae bacterium]